MRPSCARASSRRSTVGKPSVAISLLDALVVDDLPEDRARLPLPPRHPHELVGDAHSGAEAVLLGEDDFHRRECTGSILRIARRSPVAAIVKA